MSIPWTHLLVHPGNGPGSWRFVRGPAVPAERPQGRRGDGYYRSYPPVECNIISFILMNHIPTIVSTVRDGPKDHVHISNNEY